MYTKQMTDIEILQSWLKKPDNFGYFGGNDEMFKTWGYLPFGVVTRDDQDTLNLSNQQAILAEIEKINPKHIEIQSNNHWACGWVEQIAVKLFHHGKPTKAGLKALELYRALEDYPVLDESDYSEREYNATEDEICSYRKEFRQAILDYFKLESIPDNLTEEELDSIAAEIYHEDCGYRGRSDAFVDEKSIKRYFEQYAKGYCNHQDYYAPIIQKLLAGMPESVGEK